MVAATVDHSGFVSGERKTRCCAMPDLFLFPTCYLGENQPVNLIEAMAFGLPIVTTRWRSLPEMLPPNYPGLVSDQNPGRNRRRLAEGAAHDAQRNRLREHFSTGSRWNSISPAWPPPSAAWNKFTIHGL